VVLVIVDDLCVDVLVRPARQGTAARQRQWRTARHNAFR
jgi:hypothetical protein